ncbi:MAG: oligopeptide:H+ symporter [Coriobacteriales bacterium]|nr:oligopeptide:H+ symporter [Coriobacteriales bacterium]
MNTNKAAAPQSGTAPETAPTKGFFGHPVGLLNIFATEFCERFSYYGMRAILVFYLYDLTINGGLGLSQTDAMVIMSLFGSLVYLSSIVGGWLADRVLGPFRSILVGGTTIAAGHIVLGLPLGITGTVVAMVLIILGTGLLKPNVSVMVGELYARSDPRRQAGFSLLYLSINIGAFLSPLVVGSVSDSIGYHVAFIIPAVVMGLGLFVYIALSKHTLAGVGRVPTDPLTAESIRRIRRNVLIGLPIAALLAAVLVAAHLLGLAVISDAIPLVCALLAVALFIFLLRDKRVQGIERNRIWAYIPLFIAATCFFAISEQQSSTFPIVAKEFTDNALGAFIFPAAWYSSVNPLLIIALSPVFALLWTKLSHRQPSMVVKIAVGLAIAALGFIVLTIGFLISGESLLSPFWLIASLFLITTGELLLSPTGLSATSLLAPEIHLSKMMGLWFISNALGQAINTATVRLFDGAAPEVFFMSYAFVALAVALAIFLMRKLLLSLAGGVR